MMLGIIHNLYTQYSRISVTDMSANDERIQPTYDADEPLEGLIESLNECADFTATANGPILETQLVRIA